MWDGLFSEDYMQATIDKARWKVIKVRGSWWPVVVELVEVVRRLGPLRALMSDHQVSREAGLHRKSVLRALCPVHCFEGIPCCHWRRIVLFAAISDGQLKSARIVAKPTEVLPQFTRIVLQAIQRVSKAGFS